MGQVHGEEGYALRFHPARSPSLRLVSPRVRGVLHLRGHDARYLLKKDLMERMINERAREKEEKRAGEKRMMERRKGIRSDFRSFSHVPLGQGVGC